MALALDILSWTLLVCGGIFTIIGGIGMIRLPDVFSRMHSAGITETVGAGAIFVGLMVQAGWSLITVKLALIIVFMLLTNPTATHAIARAALGEGLIPLTDDEDETDPNDYILADSAIQDAPVDDGEDESSKT